MERQSTFIFIIILLSMNISGALQAQTSNQEREALVALYEATGGENWNINTNWLEGDPCENGW